MGAGTLYVTEADVHGAASALNSRGTKPTYQLIRQELGRGSYSTINKYLATWKPGTAFDLPEAPVELLGAARPLVQSIWELAIRVADDSFSEERQASAALRAELEAAVQNAEADNTKLLEVKEEVEVKLAQALDRVEELKAKLRNANKEIFELRGKVDVLKDIRNGAADQPSSASQDQASRRDCEATVGATN